MKPQYIDTSRQNEWENLTKANPATGFMQSFAWARFQNLLGWETYKIGLFDTKNKLIGGAIAAKYPHFKNKNIIYIPEGPVLPYEKPEAEKMFHLLINEIDNIADFKGENLTASLSIEPKLTELPRYFSRFKKAATDRQPLRTLITDLRLSEEKLLQKMKPKTRYNINLAHKHKVQITHVNMQDGLVDFLALYKPFVIRNNIYDRKDDSYFESLAYIYPRVNDLEIFFARYQNRILAAAIVIYYGQTATYLFGATSDQKREVMASYLLHWEIIKRAKKSGFQFYDWYSITPDDNDPHHPWSGYTVFKRKFGGEETKYIGAYDFIYNRQLYLQYLRENVE